MTIPCVDEAMSDMFSVATVHHQLHIAAPVEKVYQAIAAVEGISSWWDRQTPRHTERGLVLEHNPGPEHGIVKLRVVDLIPNERIEWECISTHPATSPASVWTGTHFIFQLRERGDKTTLVDFSQTGFDRTSRFFDSNKDAWGQVLQNLKRVVESQRS
jgi:uncharacterized protein YndB with AHSA1/START domain